ncbi:MAG: hypothetical protein WBA12_06315 [Catalinimonas sp.]
MRLNVCTTVSESLPEVAARFDQRLFEHLSPPFPSVRIVRYDGGQPGDEVHLELSFLLFRQPWVSRITTAETTADEVCFVDEGIELPFFLGRWRHRHRMLALSGRRAAIVDEIEFEAPVRWLTPLLAPVLLGQFLARRPGYRSYYDGRSH